MFGNVLLLVVAVVSSAVVIGRLAGWCINKDWETGKEGFGSFIMGCVICPVAWVAAIGCCVITTDWRRLKTFFFNLVEVRV